MVNSRDGKIWTAKPVKEEKDTSWRSIIAERVLDAVRSNNVPTVIVPTDDHLKVFGKVTLPNNSCISKRSMFILRPNFKSGLLMKILCCFIFILPFIPLVSLLAPFASYDVFQKTEKPSKSDVLAATKVKRRYLEERDCEDVG